uniref:Putative nucleotidyltransferase, ribonuclease H n=1 Tax=Tanacetum cinerariifolium TaxID=118510 RepID=A0A699QFY8_TANCI|nr:putative nucleotidyltransferase, ribonuclease H [Tanacetum cinerariifolium]
MEQLARLYVDEAVARHGVHMSSIPDRDGMYIEVLAEIVESKMIGLELEQETTKVVVIKERLKEKIVKRVKLIVEMKLLEFSVGDHVMMKVSPWKGVVRFGKKGELAPRYIGPFEILERIGLVSYRLRLLDELSIENYLSGVKLLSKLEITLIL